MYPPHARIVRRLFEQHTKQVPEERHPGRNEWRLRGMLVHSSDPLQQQQDGRQTNRHIKQRALRQVVYQMTKGTDRIQLEVAASCFQRMILFKCKMNPLQGLNRGKCTHRPTPPSWSCHLDRCIQHSLDRRPGHYTTEPIQSRHSHPLVPLRLAAAVPTTRMLGSRHAPRPAETKSQK
jgi:hypothetical protein